MALAGALATLVTDHTPLKTLCAPAIIDIFLSLFLLAFSLASLPIMCLTKEKKKFEMKVNN